MRTLVLLLLSLLTARAEPQRIVSTAPSITEILFALGLGPQVVGVTTYCRYPLEARSLPKIGTFLQPDFERILSLRPTLVFTMKNPVQLTERMQRIRLNAVELNQDTVADILASINIAGRATGREQQAKALAERLHAGIESVRATAKSRTPVSVLFVVGRTPGSLDGMITIGPNTYLDELLRLAGGRNIMDGAFAQYPKVSIEELLRRDPAVILDMGDFAHAAGVLQEKQSEVEALWRRYAKLRAVRERRVYALASDIFVVPGPRMVEAAREFFRLLQGETLR